MVTVSTIDPKTLVEDLRVLMDDLNSSSYYIPCCMLFKTMGDRLPF